MGEYLSFVGKNLPRFPSSDELRNIRTWKVDNRQDLFALMDYIRSCWAVEEGSWTESIESTEKGDVKSYQINTGDWSGNVSLIAALERNRITGTIFDGYSWRRGGYYEYHIRIGEQNAPADGRIYQGAS